MSNWGFIIWTTVSSSLAVGLVSVSHRRAEYWRPTMERIARDSGFGPVTSLSVMPLKGCGWSLGETVYGEFSVDGVPADFLMCRSRHGVRFDLTTYESRWIRGPASVDTLPKGRDAKQGSVGTKGSAVPKGDAQ